MPNEITLVDFVCPECHCELRMATRTQTLLARKSDVGNENPWRNARRRDQGDAAVGGDAGAGALGDDAGAQAVGDAGAMAVGDDAGTKAVGDAGAKAVGDDAEAVGNDAGTMAVGDTGTKAVGDDAGAKAVLETPERVAKQRRSA